MHAVHNGTTMILQDVSLFSVALLMLLHRSGALQCYSCRGNAPNEVEANIRCLENAYLEDCDDFYTYYSEVEDQSVLSYEYYEYEKEEAKENAKKGRGKSRDRDGKTRARKRPIAKEERPEKRERARERIKRQTRRGGNSIDQSEERTNELANAQDINTDYDYYYDDYNYTYGDDKSEMLTEPPEKNTEDENKDYDEEDFLDDGEVLSLPRDPEHHCYSRTSKKSWESYTVEKGCKKIAYCTSLIKNNPEWGNPWNFCCDKTRCNAKLVKDKPQRIFGMGCRQTDDCIQGTTSRPVCPNWFQSCPRISPGMVKMECRAKARGSKNKYFYAIKEKKCYCSPGHHPKGPICTSGFTQQISSLLTISISLSVWRLMQTFAF